MQVRHDLLQPRGRVRGQRALTSYTDPYAGWAIINGSSHVVRQRSPWKASFDLDSLRTYSDFTTM